MADREHRGLMATVIVLVMLVIALSISTYVFWSKSEADMKVADAAEKGKQEWKQKWDEENFKLQLALHVLGIQPLDPVNYGQVSQGVSGDADMKKVDDEYKKYENMFKNSMPAGTQFSFLALPEILMTALRSKSEQVINRDGELNKMRRDTKEQIDAEKAATQQAQMAHQQAADDLAGERTKFNQDRDTIVKKEENLRTTFNTQLVDFKKKIDDTKKDVEVKEKDISTKVNTIKNLTERIEKMQPNVFDVAHGRVVWTDQSGHIWINLGLADGLRRQVSFSVFDHESLGIEQAKRKGSIEVTQVIDQHLAEARVVSEEDIKNPILPGDQIFSPTWRPGRQVRFAFAGFFDINGDGFSDRDFVRSLITMNGGVIDAEVHDDGEMVGKLSPQTNYFVAGESPSLQRNPNEMAIKNYNAMFEEARNLAVQRISAGELLDLMGWKGGLKSISLGRGTAGDDLRPTKSGGAGTEPGGPTFKERTPPSGN